VKQRVGVSSVGCATGPLTNGEGINIVLCGGIGAGNCVVNCVAGTFECVIGLGNGALTGSLLSGIGFPVHAQH